MAYIMLHKRMSCEGEKQLTSAWISVPAQPKVHCDGEVKMPKQVMT